MQARLRELSREYFKKIWRPRSGSSRTWGVGEHTDYGLLTILLQDDAGGLEVKSGSRWIAAPPLPGSFVCNIGDMLDRMTGGLYRSTPHRVRNPAPRDRLSFPFFFDPNFFAASGRSSCPPAISPPTTGTSAGTAPASTRSTGPTATTSWARSGRSFPSCGRRCSDHPASRALQQHRHLGRPSLRRRRPPQIRQPPWPIRRARRNESRMTVTRSESRRPFTLQMMQRAPRPFASGRSLATAPPATSAASRRRAPTGWPGSPSRRAGHRAAARPGR